MPNLLKSLSINLKRLRKEKRLTQQELANLAGINLQVLKNAETETSLPQHSNLEKLAAALSIEQTELFLDPERKPSIREATYVLLQAAGLGTEDLILSGNLSKIPPDILPWLSSSATLKDWQVIRERMNESSAGKMELSKEAATLSIPPLTDFADRISALALQLSDPSDRLNLEEFMKKLLEKRAGKKKSQDVGG